MKKLIINLFYFLDSSKTYLNIKTFFYNILENDDYKYKRLFDIFMIFLVLSTVAIMIYEVNHEKWLLLNTFEYIAIIIFLIEWILRVWVYSDIRKVIISDYEQSKFFSKDFCLSCSLNKVIKQKFDFIFSPMSIVDLLAILPYYRPLRVLRIFLLFRLFKILRYSNSLKEFLHIFAERKFELYTLAMLSSVVMFFGSTIMFIYEGTGVNEKINNYFDAVYWAMITISTVGYGDIIPVTPEGKLVTLVLIINGFLVIAFCTSIVTTGLSERIDIIKQNRVEQTIQKMDNYIVVCGYRGMGSNLCEQLIEQKKKILVIDKNEEVIKNIKEKGILCIKGDATDIDFLEELKIKNSAKKIIALTNDDATNLSIILGIKTLNKNIETIAKINNPENEKKLQIAGADFIINPEENSAYVASQYLGQPVAFEAVDGILINDDSSAEVDEIDIVSNMNVVGTKVKDLEYEYFNITIIGILSAKKHGKLVFNPTNSDYVINEDDIFIVIGYKEMINEFKMYLFSYEVSK